MGYQHWEGDDLILTMEREGADTVIDVSAKVFNIKTSGLDKSSNTAKTFGRRGFNYRSSRNGGQIEMEVKVYNSLFPMIAYGGTTYASGSEIRASDGDYRWRIILWTAKPNNMKKSGSVVVPAKTGAIAREIWKDCEAVSFEKEYSNEEYWKGTIRFTMSPTDEDGYINYFFQMTSQQGTTALTTLNTTAHKGTLTWNTTTPAWTGSYRT